MFQASGPAGVLVLSEVTGSKVNPAQEAGHRAESYHTHTHSHWTHGSFRMTTDTIAHLTFISVNET